MKRNPTIAFLVFLVMILAFSRCQQTAVTSAKVYMQQSNWDKAIEQCKIAIQTVPTDAEAYYVLGRAYGFKGMYREMNDAFTNSLKNAPKFTMEIEQERNKYWVDIFNSGVALVKQEKTVDAIAKFSLATEIMPNKIEAYKNLAYAYSVNQNDSMAILTYQTALQMHPNDLETKNFLGQLYYRGKKYDKAVEILGQVVITADPKTKLYSDALYTVAYSYDLMGQSDKAIETYQNALRISPNDKDLMFNLGRLYFMQGKYDLAIENFLNVLQTNPDDFDANLNIGNAYLQMEKYKESIPYFEKASVVKPTSANAWNNLGVAYVRSGVLEKGKEAFAKADQLKKQQ